MDVAETFISEADDIFDALEATLLAFEDASDQMELVHQAFRALHTLKGSGAMAGFRGVASFAHDLEAAFDRVRSGTLPMSSELADLALRAIDVLKVRVHSNDDGSSVEAAEKDIREALVRCRPDAESGGDAKAARSVEGTTQFTVRLSPGGKLESHHQPVGEVLDLLRSRSASFDVVAEPIKEVTLDGFEIGDILAEWHISLTADTTRNALVACLEGWPPSAYEVTCTGQLFEDPEASSKTSDAHKEARPAASSHRTEMIKVDVQKLDLLLDLVGELVITRSRLLEVAREHRQPKLLSLSEELTRLTTELRTRSMSLRMQPIGQTFQRYSRLVRDLGRSLGREVQLHLEGGDTEIDKGVLDKLGDCLVHLVRNAMDHGLETPEDRVALGKDKTGHVHLSASQEQGGVMIRVRDDGRGLDRNKILQKALSKGIASETDELTDGEVFLLIFEPGFSTAEQLSDVSGRGVGMDVVRRTIDALGGHIELDSELGRGTTVSIRLPLTLAIIEGLLVHIDGDPFILPLENVEECIEAPRDHDAPGRRLVDVRGQYVPYISLRTWFGVSEPCPHESQLVIANFRGRRAGLLVDHVVGQHQTVLKKMSPMTEVPGFSGSTVLGNGRVALVLDGDAILNSLEQGRSAELEAAFLAPPASESLAPLGN